MTLQICGRFVLMQAFSGMPSTPPILHVILDATVDLPVLLKDVQPAKSPGAKSLDKFVTNVSQGPPGKFYKGENAVALVKTFKTEGSCARIALEETANDGQKQHFERFVCRLKIGGLVGSSSRCGQ